MTYREPLCILIGGLIGVGVGYLLAKRKCEEQITHDVAEARAEYKNKLAELSAANRNKPDISTLIAAKETEAEPQEEHPMTDYSTTFQQEVPKTDIPEDAVPAVVGPRLYRIEYDDWNGPDPYEKQSIIIYIDGVAARDDNDDIIDVESTIGADAYNEVMMNTKRGFADVIYVRNDATGTDYEVSNSPRTYSEVTGVFLKE